MGALFVVVLAASLGLGLAWLHGQQLVTALNGLYRVLSHITASGPPATAGKTPVPTGPQSKSGAFQAPIDPSALPAIKISPTNMVPECVTPGRLMVFLRSRNPELSARFANVAVEYMRSGDELGVRWDFAFFQMIFETGSLKFRSDSRSGDLKPTQNNFAGLGATGPGEPGETFKDVATGVRAHLEHLLIYAGERIENPTAQRTRKVQEWGVLTKWQSRFARPITFTDLAQQWAPGSASYTTKLAIVAEHFFSEFCTKLDNQLDLTPLGARPGAYTPTKQTIHIPVPTTGRTL